MTERRARRQRSGFVCRECGGETGQWYGRCPHCGEWNTLVRAPASAHVTDPGRNAPQERPRPLREGPPARVKRMETGIGEFDRALGGGLVPGSVVLLGGDPGVGKSTLGMHAAGSLASRGTRALYVSGEESREQVSLRADRVQSGFEEVWLASASSVTEIERWTREHSPGIVVVDSIQTAFTPEVDGAPGSLIQVRESALRLHALAKSLGVAVVLLGHVTKDGSVAGPRTLEHMVDAVLYLEGESVANYRVLRAVKNRFGSTDEIGIFEMGEKGLTEVRDPSAVLAAASTARGAGSAVVPTIEGTRPILLEVQALVTATTWGTPQRVTSGIDPKRLAVLIAVLRKHAGVDVTDQDVFLNVVSGIRVGEPAVDLGVLASIASSHADRPLPVATALFGEVGLDGELRSVSQPDRRVAEALRVGFARVVVPSVSLDKLGRGRRDEVVAAGTVVEALRALGLDRRAGGERGRSRRRTGRADSPPDVLDGGFA